MGNQKIIQLTYEHFQSEKSSKCDLLINISQNSLSYAIINQEQDLLEVLFDTQISSSIEEALGELVEQQPVLRRPFRKIKICLNTIDFTFIPQSLYSDSSLSSYSKYINTNSLGEVLVNSIRPARIKNIFSMPAGLQNKLTATFPSSQIFNQATVFIESIRRVMKDSIKTSLFLHLQHSNLQIAVINRSGLLYYNFFTCPTADDLNYYLLLVIQQLELSLIQTSVTVAGEITLDSSYYGRIRKYFEEVIFADSKRIINQPAIFDRIPSQLYFTLLGLNLCD